MAGWWDRLHAQGRAVAEGLTQPDGSGAVFADIDAGNIRRGDHVYVYKDLQKRHGLALSDGPDVSAPRTLTCLTAYRSSQ